MRRSLPAGSTTMLINRKTAPGRRSAGLTSRVFGITFLVMWVLGALTVGQAPRADDASSPVVIYPAGGAFEDVMENIEMAITNRGMLVSGTLHVNDMLQRTGKDLGFDQGVYLRAQSVEFCSALMSHRMVAADPGNLVICPFTVAAYVLADNPEQVYVAYRRQYLAGDSAEATRAIMDMLDGIAREAAE